MSLAARVTKADNFPAPDGKSHGHTASSDSNVPISSGRMWTGRRDRHSRRNDFRCFER
jgi:hypothetical protein